MSVSIGSLKYLVSADISDYTSKMAQLRALRKTASKEEQLAIDKQIKLLRDQQRKEKQILRDRSKAYNDFANTIRSSVKWISVGLVGVVATASKNLMDMERETKNLSAALSDLGSNNQGLLSTLTDLADQINEVTGINQQLINDAMAIGLQFGAAQDDIDEYAKALAALSSISGKSIQQLAQSLNQMYIKGDFSSLEKLGIYIDQNKSKQQQFNDVIAQGLEKYTELNNQTSNTLTRNFNTIKNVAGSVFEEIGKKFNSVIATPISQWVDQNRELIINSTTQTLDFVATNWKQTIVTLLTVYSSFNKNITTQFNNTASLFVDAWKNSGKSLDSYIHKLYRNEDTLKRARDILADYNKMTLDQRRNVVLNKDHTVINRIIAAMKVLNIRCNTTNKEFFDINSNILKANKLLITSQQLLLNNVFVTGTWKTAIIAVNIAGKVLNTTLKVTLALVKGIARATVIMAVFEAAIWAVEKAWGYVWQAIEKVGKYLGLINADQKQVNTNVDTQSKLEQDVKIKVDDINDVLDEQETKQSKITDSVKQQSDNLSELLLTTANLNKTWDDMVHPITNINVLYHEYKNLQQEIADKQQEIYSNQQNVLIDVETKNKRNIDLVNQYNDLLKRRNTLTQSLLSAKQKQREEEEKAAAAEQERIKKQLEEQKALNIKRQQLKLQLEIAKAETAGNKDRVEALKIGQEVANIAKEYKISIEDALKVYRTLNAEKNAGKEGYDAEGNKLTKAQLRRQKRAQENLKRYEESQATAPGEQRKTGVRRISASKSAVERWRREAAGNFTGRDIKPVSERITANQIKANIPDASNITPITPSTAGISDQTQISTPQTTAVKTDNILNQIATKIDQMVSGFDTFTQQFAQTFSA